MFRDLKWDREVAVDMSFADLHFNLDQYTNVVQSWRKQGAVVDVIQLPVQSVPITTKIVISNPVYGEVF